MEKSNKNNSRWVYILIGIICIVVAVVLVVLFLLQGSTKTKSGSEVKVTESVACESEGFFYPFFKYDNSKGKSIKINAIFNDDKLDTINLIYKLDYDSAGQVERSNTENHIAMNESFYASSLSVDSFDVHYSNLGDTMQMTLYAEVRDLNGVTAKYFLLDGVNSFTKDALAQKYSSQGLDCVINE